MRKRILSFIFASAVALSMAGCGQNGPAKAAETGASTQGEDLEPAAEKADSAEKAQPEEHGSLKVSFPAGNIRVAINILALEKGYFAEEGVEVEPVNIGGQDALTAINSGSDQIDILNTGFVPDLQAIGSGYELTVFGGTAVEGGAIIAKSGKEAAYQDASDIIHLEAVEKARLGFVRNEASWVVTRQYLLDHGATAEQLAAIEDEAGGNISYYQDETSVAQAVQKGEIDLGFLPMEYALLYGDAYQLKVVAAAGDLQNNYVCCREVTSPAKLSEKFDSFTAYEKARIKAFEYYSKGRDDETVRQEVVKTVSDYSGKEPEYVDTYLYGGVTKYATDPNADGVVKYVEAAVNSGLLKSAGVDFAAYDITQNVDVSAYQAAIEELVKESPDNAFYAQLLQQFQTDNQSVLS